MLTRSLAKRKAEAPPAVEVEEDVKDVPTQAQGKVTHMNTSVQQPMFDYTKTYYRMMNSSYVHMGFKWKLGLNKLEEAFYPYDKGARGGLYFSSIDHIRYHTYKGTILVDVRIPTYANVHIHDISFKADYVIISNPRPLSYSMHGDPLANKLTLLNNPGLINRPSRILFDDIIQVLKKEPTYIHYCEKAGDKRLRAYIAQVPVCIAHLPSKRATLSLWSLAIFHSPALVFWCRDRTPAMEIAAFIKQPDVYRTLKNPSRELQQYVADHDPAELFRGEAAIPREILQQLKSNDGLDFQLEVVASACKLLDPAL